MSHTPGPYQVHSVPMDGDDVFHAVVAPDGIAVADIYLAGGRSAAEHMDNARLLAAAPDLLEALKECGHFIAGMHPDMMDHDTQQKQERIITAARFAIARATTDTTEKP